MLEKKQDKKKDVTKVTFILPAEVEGETVHLLGDFNEWHPSHTMARLKDGHWEVSVDLQPNKEYQFRYLVDGQTWLNDPAADKYVANPYGCDNCVVTT
jgi:1,4-alpha-glucan branching enzyme